MSRMRGYAAYFLAGVVAGMLVAPPALVAHPASSWYDFIWGPQDLPVINVYWDDSFFNTAAWRARVEDGFDEWSVIQPSSFQFFSPSTGTVNQVWRNTCNANTDVTVFARDLSGEAVGRTVACETFPGSGVFVQVHVGFDNQVTWNVGTDVPSASEMDAWHIASHEFGHATGWTPHLATSLDCDQVAPIDFQSWQTMCQTANVLGVGTEYGKTLRRSTETHDQHTFNGAY